MESSTITHKQDEQPSDADPDVWQAEIARLEHRLDALERRFEQHKPTDMSLDAERWQSPELQNTRPSDSSETLFHHKGARPTDWTDADETDGPESSWSESPSSSMIATEDEDTESDEVVSEYMSRLLNRVNGGITVEPDAKDASNDDALPIKPSLLKPSPLITSDVTDQTSDMISVGNQAPRAPATAQAQQDTVFDCPVVYAPRSLAPERQANLAEMRELANVSAEIAIRKAETREVARRYVNKVLLVLVGLACGVFLLYAAMRRESEWTYVGVTIAFLVAGVSAIEAIWLMMQFVWAKFTMPRLSKSSSQSGGD